MRYSPTQYAAALRDLVEEAPAAKRRETVQKFLDALAKQGALPLLSEIVREFEHAGDKKAGLHNVSIAAPEHLHEGTVGRKLPFKVRVNVVRDMRLRGGAVVEIDGLRVDNSIKMRMERIREALVG